MTAPVPPTPPAQPAPKSPYASYLEAVRGRTAAGDAQNERVLAEGALSLYQAATETGTGSFDVLRYPQDLSTSPQHPHYVMFYITVRETDLAISKVERSSVQFDYSKNNTGVTKDAATATATTTITGVIGGATAGYRAGSFVGQFAGPTTQATMQVAGSVAGAAIGGAALSGLGEGKNQVTLKSAIALYMTGKPSAEYQANWADEELGIVGGIAQNLGQIQGISDLLDIGKMQSVMGGGFSSYILSQSLAAGNVAGLGNFGAATSAAAGVTPNPFRAQLFKSMGFRTFSFDYVFLPKNDAEYVQAQQIIYTFKRFMHPTLGSSKFILNYPAEFTIAYYHKNDINRELYKISNCALTKLSVEYGGDDFTTFKGTKGAPTEIALKLEFTELEVLSRERIEVGY